MKRDVRHPNQIRITSLQRYAAWHYASRLLRATYITEFPKSGGTWLCQLISEAALIPFPQHRMMSRSRAVFHSHYTHLPRNKKVVCQTRDGRDVMVSSYYHFLRPLELDKPLYVRKWCQLMAVHEVEDIESHLPKFIEIFFEKFRVGGKPTNWLSYHTALLQQDTTHLYFNKYEDLLNNTEQALVAVLAHLDLAIDSDNVISAIDKYSFEKQSKRTRGEEDKTSFLRKGIAGDWKNVFSPAARIIFDQLAGDMLITLDYENDHQWVKR